MPARSVAKYDWVHSKLERWGDWQIETHAEADFPRTTLLARMLEEGQIVRQPSRSRILCRDMPPDIRCTHMAVLHLDRRGYLIVVVRYTFVVHEGGRRWTNQERADLMRVSPRQFREELRIAKRLVASMHGVRQVAEIA